MKRSYLAVPLVLLFLLPLRADDMTVREGLWYMHIVTTSMPGKKQTESMRQICRNRAFDQYVHSNPNLLPGFTCTSLNDKDQKNTHVADLKCRASRASAEVHEATMLIDQYHLRAERHMFFKPSWHGVAEQIVVEEDSYIGSCPLELKPGDEKLEDGTVRHLWKQPF